MPREASGASVIAVQDVPREQTGSYGIVATESFQGRQGRINAIVEKPEPEVAPSTLAVVGRYVLSPRIFSLLETDHAGRGRRDPADRRDRGAAGGRAASTPTVSRARASTAARISA